MKILSLNSLGFNSQLKKKDAEAKLQNEQKVVEINSKVSYPKGFFPYFGARLNRTPENFYEQEFNKKGMPYTLRKHLESNYEVNKLKRPMQLNKEAFADLELCESIEDVKEMFPDEPLFQNLKTLETIRPKQGYLRDLRSVDTKNNEVLSSGEDLTVYLLKKIYLEGKDIDEINQDFKKDMKPELKVEKATKEGAYFLHSTLHSLGVYLPDKSYWASLQATRLDKEYIPSSWTLTKPRKKPVFTKPRVKRTVVLSDEERQRRSEMMINRWIEMTPAQRLAQLAKMKEGQQNSVFYNHSGAIMLIATDRANFTDKMYQFFREKGQEKNCPDDLNNPDKSQVKLLNAFWAENSRLKRSFAYHIGATLKEFEAAVNSETEEPLLTLLEKADKIRRKNEVRVMRRKLANPEYVKKAIIENMLEQSVYFPEKFNEKYMKFLMSHKRFNEELIPTYAQLPYAQSDEQKSAIIKKVQGMANSLYAEFFSKNKRDGISANTSLAFVLRTVLENMADQMLEMGFSQKARALLTDSYQILTGNSNYLAATIQKYKLSDIVKINKPFVEKMMNCYTRGLSDDEVKIFADNLMLHMKKIVDRMNEKTFNISDEFGFVVKNSSYTTLSNSEVRERCRKYLPKVLKDLENNKKARKVFMDFLKDYEGLLLYTNDLIRSAMTTKDPNTKNKLEIYKATRNYVYESIIDDLLIECSKN